MENNNEIKRNVESMLSSLDGIMKFTEKSVHKSISKMDKEQAIKFQQAIKDNDVIAKVDLAKKDIKDLQKFFLNFK